MSLTSLVNINKKKMKLFLRSIFFVLFLVCGLTASAQVPTTMDYQIMATDSTMGQVLANKELDRKSVV